MKYLTLVRKRLNFSFWQLLIVIDQLFNVLIGVLVGDGYADEVLSAKAFRLRNDGWFFAYKVINLIFFLQKDHCKEAYMHELKRRGLPPEYRTTK